MHEDDGSLKVLARTPEGLPEFEPRLEPVVRRSRALRARNLTARGVAVVALVVAVAAPIVALTGLLRGSSTRSPVAGDGSHPLKLISYNEPSEAMDPTVRVGQTVLIDVDAYRDGRVPAAGDVVLLAWHTDGQTFRMLKRVIGLPGQSVVIRRGVVFVDGRRRNEPYLNHMRDPGSYGPFIVRPGRVFVLGDNRINSNDSRFGLGQIPIGDLIGKMVGVGGDAPEPPPAGTASSP